MSVLAAKQARTRRGRVCVCVCVCVYSGTPYLQLHRGCLGKVGPVLNSTISIKIQTSNCCHCRQRFHYCMLARSTMSSSGPRLGIYANKYNSWWPLRVCSLTAILDGEDILISSIFSNTLHGRNAIFCQVGRSLLLPFIAHIKGFIFLQKFPNS